MEPLLGASLLAAATLAAAAPPMPLHSWSTVPTFQHLASVNATLAQPFPPARLRWLASTFPLVVMEHAQGMGEWAYSPPSGPGSVWGPRPFVPPVFIEEHFAAGAAAIKALNASVVVLYYQQITGALPYYRQSQPLMSHAGWALDDNCNPVTEDAGSAAALGDILPNYVTYGYDHTQAGVTENFVAAFLNMTGSTSVDGTFIDTAGCYDAPGQAAASLATVQAMQAARPDKIVGFHTQSALSGANGFSAAMDYT